MIVAIDQSPLWRAPRGSREELSRLLEALFHSSQGRRPASGLDVFLLAGALECSEAAIGLHLARSRSARTQLVLLPPRVPPAYSPTRPA
jgi:hypothetical protein